MREIMDEIRAAEAEAERIIATARDDAQARLAAAEAEAKAIIAAAEEKARQKAGLIRETRRKDAERAAAERVERALGQAHEFIKAAGARKDRAVALILERMAR